MVCLLKKERNMEARRKAFGARQRAVSGGAVNGGVQGRERDKGRGGKRRGLGKDVTS